MKKIIIYIDTKIFSGFFMNLYRSISINKTISKLIKKMKILVHIIIIKVKKILFLNFVLNMVQTKVI